MVGFQRHHLIPVQIYMKPCFSDVFKKARKGGFDQRDFVSNGIYLPSKESLALKSGRPLHRGPHPRYNDMVASRLEQIVQSEKQISTDCRALAVRIFNMQKALRKMLLRSPSTLLLNNRDPMSRTVDFTHLDATVDQLWNGIKNDNF